MNYAIQILGISFFGESVESCYNLLNQNGGLLTAPSGPGLANTLNDTLYYESLRNSDIVIPDSGYMVLLWNVFHRPKIQRVSGLAFINYFVCAYPNEPNQRLLLVNPTLEEQRANVLYLQSVGIKVSEKDCYIAPFYRDGQVEDTQLCTLIEQRKPTWVLINIGGGTQEILGYYLKKHLSYLPAIACTGAAIAFKTGKQVDIPAWADRLYLGWLFRILSSPRKYYGRYAEALPLAKLIWKYGENQIFIFNPKER